MTPAHPSGTTGGGHPPPAVLFVSKPLAAPLHDGSLCLVRDLATHVPDVTPLVMGVRGGAPPPGLPERVRVLPTYPRAGGFAPGLRQNAAGALGALRSPRAALWHFVFAPNRRTSQVARALAFLRRVPTVQTVASAPRAFDDVPALLFGDAVVVQSAATRRAFERAAEAGGHRLPPLTVIPPPVPDLAPRTAEAHAALLAELGWSAADTAPLGLQGGVAAPTTEGDARRGAPLFVYPGDLEVSGGAEFVAALVRPLLERLPHARVVFAYRAKTPAAEGLADGLRARLPPDRVRVVGRLRDVLTLLAGATAVLFPVDDLYGKVDLPIVLLESMTLGVPVLALDHGPLAELEGAERLPADPARWLEAMTALAAGGERRAALIAAQRAAVERRYHARVVGAAYRAVYGELLGVP